MAVVRRPFARARRLARQVLWECGFDEPELIDPLVVAARQGIQLIRCKLDGATAQLLRHGDRAIIRVSDQIVQAGRERFSVAHELGHFLLGHRVSGETDSAMHSAHQEREADIFATEFLMPEAMFQPLVYGETAAINLDTIAILARRFRSSLVATAVRYVEFAPTPCAIVYSEHGVVRWAKRSRTLTKRIPADFAIGAGALASSVDMQPLDTPRIVPECAWFGTHAVRSTSSVVEHAVNIPEPGWGGTLSLLAFPTSR